MLRIFFFQNLAWKFSPDSDNVRNWIWTSQEQRLCYGTWREAKQSFQFQVMVWGIFRFLKWCRGILISLWEILETRYTQPSLMKTCLWYISNKYEYLSHIPSHPQSKAKAKVQSLSQGGSLTQLTQLGHGYTHTWDALDVWTGECMNSGNVLRRVITSTAENSCHWLGTVS